MSMCLYIHHHMFLNNAQNTCFGNLLRKCNSPMPS